jgi:RNA polymerase-binding protein DksA
MKNHQVIKQHLIARRVEIIERLERVNQDVTHANKPLEADFAEQAVERENDQVLDALSEGLRAEISRIETALDRLDEGDYGICESCGREIPRARLEALPDARRCLKCEMKTESESNQI